jgi:cell division GTPase FtsZ
MTDMGMMILGTGEAEGEEKYALKMRFYVRCQKVWNESLRILRVCVLLSRAERLECGREERERECKQLTKFFLSFFRAKKAAELAIHNQLLGDFSLKEAKGVLINVTG